MLQKIISGGQTGADYTGLQVAKEFGIPTGGYCPLGCRTDVGPRPELVVHFGLVETDDDGYVTRTTLNARESDGTVWFGKTSSPGFHCTRKSIEMPKRKPFIENPEPKQLVDWILKHNIKVLNVAGNRERTNPRVVNLTRHVLSEAIRILRGEHISQDAKANPSDDRSNHPASNQSRPS